jgi:ribosome-associated protein
MKTEKIEITSDYIPLGQFLKLSGIADTGGQAKILLLEEEVTVNGERENRRGRKLYPGDVVAIKNMGAFEIVAK